MTYRSGGGAMASVRWDKQKRRFRVDWRENGKRFRKFFHFQHVALAFAAKIERYKDDLSAGFKSAPPVLFKDFVEVYISEGLENMSQSHRDKETKRLRQIAYSFSNFTIQEVTPIALKRFIRMRLGQGVSNKTVNNELGSISALMREGMDRGLITANPVAMIKKLPKAPTRIAHVVTVADFNKFLGKADDALRRVAIFLYNTGFRVSEALSLKWGDVDCDRRMIYMPNIKGRTTKTYKDRFVPMSDATMHLLSTPGDGEHVFPIKQNTLRDKWDTACRRAEVKFNRHDLRHTYISLMVAGMRKHGLDNRTIMAFSGHSTLSMLENYTHLVPGKYDHVRNVVNVGSEWLSSNVVNIQRQAG